VCLFGVCVCACVCLCAPVDIFIIIVQLYARLGWCCPTTRHERVWRGGDLEPLISFIHFLITKQCFNVFV